MWDWSFTSKDKQLHRLKSCLNGALSEYLFPVEPCKLFITTTPYVIGMENVDELFPHVKVIVIIRDGKSVVESGVIGGFWRFEEGVELWRKSAEIIKCMEQREGTLIVRYEDLVKAPEDTMDKIFHFLNLSSETYSFERMNQLPVFGSSTNRQNDQFIYETKPKTDSFNPIGRSDSWTPIMHYRFDLKCSELAQHFGYEKADYRVDFFHRSMVRLEALKHSLSRHLKTLRRLKRIYPKLFAETI